MDFPKSVPNIGLVGGRFVDENPATGQPGSLIPSVWGKSVTLEVLSVYLAAGIVPEEGRTDQLAAAIEALLKPKANRATTLGGYGIVDAYTRTDIDYYLGRKADKATTLGGYGIVDAYTRTDIDYYLNRKADKATTLGGYGIVDAYNRTDVDYYLNGKADKASTLNGYGIAIATQQEAEAGAENTKPVTALRVFQAIATAVKQATASLAGLVKLATKDEAETGTEDTKAMTALRVAQSIAKRVVGATETVIGVSRFATLAEVVTGASGAIAVSPSYMVSGLSYSFGASGYIKLPSFLGGFMVQWGPTDESNSVADERYFPTPFPGEVYGAWLQLNSGTPGGMGSSFGTIVQVLSPSKYIWTAAGSYGGGGKAFMIALGR